MTSDALLLPRYRYREHHFLNTLTSLVEVMYCGGEAQKDLLPLSTLHMMASSHSLFLPTMLDSHEEPSLCLAKGEPGAGHQWRNGIIVGCFLRSLHF